MHISIRAIGLITIGVSAVSCSKKEIDNPTTSNNGPGCNALLSIATSKLSAPPCTTTASYTTATGSTTVTITGSGTALIAGADSGPEADAAATATFGVVITRTGQPQAGPLSGSTSGMTGTITVTNGSAGYLTTTNTGSNQGTFTLNLTKVTVLTNTANGIAYLVDGSLDATVPAVTSTGASGTVTLHIDFTNN